MQTELEVKFLNIDTTDMRRRLEIAGAILVAPERLMRRRNFDFPDLPRQKNHSAWVRVRDESDIVTMTYKQVDDYTVTGTKEVNLIVDSFDYGTQFLHALGLIETSYQETRRESWTLESVQIELDSWPWIPTFIELEGPSEAALQSVAKTLELDWSTHRAGDVSATYQIYYDIQQSDIIGWPNTTFDPMPEWLESKRRKVPVT
jgi:adenylate cyclase class 2